LEKEKERNRKERIRKGKGQGKGKGKERKENNNNEGGSQPNDVARANGSKLPPNFVREADPGKAHRVRGGCSPRGERSEVPPQ